MCISGPDYPDQPPPPPPVPPAPQPTARQAEAPAVVRERQNLANRLGTASLIIPFHNTNVPS